MFDKLSRYC